MIISKHYIILKIILLFLPKYRIQIMESLHNYSNMLSNAGFELDNAKDRIKDIQQEIKVWYPLNTNLVLTIWLGSRWINEAKLRY